MGLLGIARLCSTDMNGQVVSAVANPDMFKVGPWLCRQYVQQEGLKLVLTTLSLTTGLQLTSWGLQFTVGRSFALAKEFCVWR